MAGSGGWARWIVEEDGRGMGGVSCGVILFGLGALVRDDMGWEKFDRSDWAVFKNCRWENGRGWICGYFDDAITHVRKGVSSAYSYDGSWRLSRGSLGVCLC